MKKSKFETDNLYFL